MKSILSSIPIYRSIRFPYAFELLCWLAGLFLFAVFDPSSPHIVSFCPVDGLGMDWCPGCGLGRSIAFLLHGELRLSLESHWLGIPALLILLRRVAGLWKQCLHARNYFAIHQR